jgi:hypothetical protein
MATQKPTQSKTTQEPKANQEPKAAQKPKSKPPVLVLRKSDTPTDNFPFSANQVIEQHTNWLTKMHNDGYYLSSTLLIAVGSIKEEYYVFYLR